MGIGNGERVEYARFNTKNIAYTPRFIAVLLVCLTDRIYVVDAEDPFILREFHIAAEIM